MKLSEVLMYEMFKKPEQHFDGQDEGLEKFVEKNTDFFKNLVQASKTNFAKDMISSGDAFVRGTNDHIGSTYIGKVHKERRKPVDTADFIDDFIENYRKKHFPDVPSRQTSTFGVKVSISGGKGSWARSYGRPFIAIFKNGYKCFQSATTKDLYVISGDTLHALLKQSIDKPEKKESAYKEIEKILDKHFDGGYTDFTDMKNDGKTEVIFEHKGYWAFQINPWILTSKYLNTKKEADILKPENIKKIIDMMK